MLPKPILEPLDAPTEILRLVSLLGAEVDVPPLYAAQLLRELRRARSADVSLEPSEKDRVMAAATADVSPDEPAASIELDLVRVRLYVRYSQLDAVIEQLSRIAGEA